MTRQFISFRMGRTLFGVDALLVREICRDVTVTPVSPAPEFVRGVTNLRGHIIVVADVGIVAGMSPRCINGPIRCIILKADSDVVPLRAAGLTIEHGPVEATAFPVDEVVDLVRVDESAIAPPPAHMPQRLVRYVAGVVPLANELMTVLHIAEMMERTSPSTKELST